MSYERSIAQAQADAKATRLATPPDFALLEPRIAARRQTRSTAEIDARVRARRWLGLAVLGFALTPADLWLRAWAFEEALALGGVTVAIALPVAMLAWAAWLVTRPSFTAQVLVRSIAVSNLLVALLLALAVGGLFGALGQILVAIGCARALMLLGDRGLDTHDPGSSFNPVGFRGFLVLALILAFADAQTLGFSALTQATYLVQDSRTLLIASRSAIALIAAGVMVLNVWGLLRLRTWAMLLNIVTNVAIAWLALAGALSVNDWVAASLTATATVQLLLPVPILATWLGDSGAGGRAWGRAGALLRALVPIAAVVTVAAALSHLGLTRMWGWLDGYAGTTAVRRGLDWTPPAELMSQLAEGDQISGVGDPNRAYGPRLRPGLTFLHATMVGCDLAHANADELRVEDSDFRGAKLDGARLRRSVFVNVDLRGASFRDADLEGALFAGSDLDGIAWVGATCPDGVLATADEGCLAHLATPHEVEAQAVARPIGPHTHGCWFDLESECEGRAVHGPAKLVAQGDDLRLVWAHLSGRGELLLERTSGTTWADPSDRLRVVAAPTPGSEVDEVDVFVVRVVGERDVAWRLHSFTRADAWRARIREARWF